MIRVTRHKEKLARHPGAWLRMIFLSDLRADGSRSKTRYERLAIETQALDPDVLFFVGGFVRDRAAAVQDLKPLARVTAHLGRYFILGDHDFFDNPPAIRQVLRGWGIADLTNSHVALRKEGHVLQLSGLDDHAYGRPLVPPLCASKEIPHVTVAHEADARKDFEEKDTDLLVTGRGRRSEKNIRHLVTRGGDEIVVIEIGI